MTHLSIAQVYAALTYYHANREEIDTDLAEEQEAYEQLAELQYKNQRQIYKHSHLRKKSAIALSSKNAIALIYLRLSGFICPHLRLKKYLYPLQS